MHIEHNVLKTSQEEQDVLRKFLAFLHSEITSQKPEDRFRLAHCLMYEMVLCLEWSVGKPRYLHENFINKVAKRLVRITDKLGDEDILNMEFDIISRLLHMTEGRFNE